MFNSYLSKYNYEKICRTCLKCNENMTSVFDAEVLNMLTVCTSLTISLEDGLPNQICTPCCSKTHELYEFRQQCENSDHLLRQALLLEEDRKFTKEEITVTESSYPVKLEPVEEKNDDFHENLNSVIVKKDEEVHESLDVDNHDDDENSDDDEDRSSVQNSTEPIPTNTSTRKRARRYTSLRKALAWGLDKCDPSTKTCKICNKTFTFVRSLARHMEIHNENRKFNVVCKICKKGFLEKGALTNHMLRHKGEARFKCDKCDKMFYKRSALSVHMKRQHKVKPDGNLIDNLDLDEVEDERRNTALQNASIEFIPNYTKKVKKNESLEKALAWGLDKCDPSTKTCKICNKSFVNVRSLARHMELHNTNREFHVMCEICKKGFYETGALTKHMLRHKGETRYNCDKCPKKFYELCSLANHMKSHHPESVESFTCTECNKTFVLQLQLDAHIEQSHTDPNKYVCTECGEGYHHLSKLRKHQLKHTQERPFNCLKCDNAFKTQMALNNHIEYVHFNKNESKRTICNICGKNVVDLQQHLQVHNEKHIKCTECPKLFKSENSLKAHTVKHHNPNSNSTTQSKKTFLCSICGYTAESRAGLERHSQHKHSTERPNKCPVCSKAFKCIGSLKTHIRFSHNNERHVKCTVCSKVFYSNSILRIHMRTHTGERPYQCSVCAKTFAQGSTLKTHMKMHDIQLNKKNDDFILDNMNNAFE